MALLTLLAVGPWSQAQAQTVQGQLLDQATGEPIEGALALLLDSAGVEVDGALTNPSGRFRLRARHPGVYTITTDRIGYESITSEPLTLETGRVSGLRLQTGQTAIELEELRVEGSQRCLVRPQEGLEVARVWEEARKALSVQEWTDRKGLYRFQVAHYDRDLDLSARRVLSETRQTTTGVFSSPIKSLPAEDLLTDGFIRPGEDGALEYFGPDGTVLLSDLFLDTHCFRLTTDPDQPTVVGLTFEPVQRGRIKDVVGTLWLNRETAGLEYLEYGYTWSRYQETQGLARGRVEFEELPDGSWIVRKWWIRMPKLAQDLTRAGSGRLGIQVQGIRESGGEVTRIQSMTRRSAFRGGRGSLSGVVWDSTRHGPVEGAQVFLSGTSYAGVTDPEGRFTIDGVSPGVFTLSFLHPRLDSLMTRAPGVEVEIVAGQTTEVTLGIPSPMSIIRAACRGRDRLRRSAVISGQVTEEGTGTPIPGATVRLEWQEVGRLGPGQVTAQDRWYESMTDGRGRYTVCSAPADELISVVARFGDKRSDVTEVMVEEDSFSMVDLVVPPPSGPQAPAAVAVGAPPRASTPPSNPPGAPGPP